jgi:hypothetical protein
VYEDQRHDGAYYVRGAIAWPVLNEATGSATGFALVAAQRISTGRVYVFAETEFVCIDNVLEGGKIAVQGLAPWFNWAWAKLHCDTYHRSQNDDLNRDWVIQCMRSPMINPQPGFPHVLIGDVGDAVAVLYSWQARGALAMHPESLLVKQLNLWEGAGRKAMLPGVLAVLALVAGIQRWPFRPLED